MLEELATFIALFIPTVFFVFGACVIIVGDREEARRKKARRIKKQHHATVKV